MRTFKTMFKLSLLHILAKSRSNTLGERNERKNPKPEQNYKFQKNFVCGIADLVGML